MCGTTHLVQGRKECLMVAKHCLGHLLVFLMSTQHSQHEISYIRDLLRRRWKERKGVEEGRGRKGERKEMMERKE